MRSSRRYGTRGNSSANLLGLSARLGYAAPLGDRTALWIRGGFAFTRLARSYGDDPPASVTSPTFSLFAPIVFEPAPHFFAGAGPSAVYGKPLTLAGSADNQVTLGLAFTLGGYF